MDGIVVCPAIKSNICNVCKRSGHVANYKYCPVLKANLHDEDDKKKKESKTKVNMAAATFVNRYDALAFHDVDSDSDVSISPDESIIIPIKRPIISRIMSENKRGSWAEAESSCDEDED
jgi:hypothetical protein